MLKLFDEQAEPMDIESIEDKYPDTKYIVRVKNALDDKGVLVAVSEDNASFDDLCKYYHELKVNAKEGDLYGLFGSYNNGGAIGVQYEVKR